MAIAPSDRKAWARERFRGFHNLLAPSFLPDMQTLDEDGIRLDVSQSVAHGFFGTLCAVETGLSLAEAQRFVAVAADEAGGRLEVGVSLFTDSFERSVALLQHAERVGASFATLAFPLSFWPPDEDALYRVARDLCEATGLGVVLLIADKLGFERLHPSGVPFGAFDRLVHLPNVVALRAASLEFGALSQCFERWGDQVLVAAEPLADLPLLTRIYGQQWSGGWPVEALQSPEHPYAVEFFRLLNEGRRDEAMRLYWDRLHAAQRGAGLSFSGGAYHWSRVKYYQWCTGGNGGVTRQPVMRLFQRDIERIRATYKRLGITPREPDEEFFEGRRQRARAAQAGGVNGTTAATGH